MVSGQPKAKEGSLLKNNQNYLKPLVDEVKVLTKPACGARVRNNRYTEWKHGGTYVATYDVTDGERAAFLSPEQQAREALLEAHDGDANDILGTVNMIA